MVFVPEGQFQQFPHCKFRENVVRLLYIPSIHTIRQKINPNQENNDDSKDNDKNNHPSYFFLSINKYGKVGLYDPERFSLIHTYCLDLSVPMHPHQKSSYLSKHRPPPPKCERTHLVIDATYAPDSFSLIFATTKNLLQWYDIGEIQQQNIGLELFPRKEFMGLFETSFPLLRIPNQGHVESHRLFGLSFMPTCLEYFPGDKTKAKLFIGDVNGGISILSIPNPKYPLGRRKIRGKLHNILMSDLMSTKLVQYYKAHHQPVTDIFYLSERDLVLSCSKDRKFSVFVKDLKEAVDNIIVSVIKGVNSITYSPELKMIATGSDDYIVRLFSQFIMKMPQMELLGHRSPVITVQFAVVDSNIAEEATSSMESDDNPTLLFSYAADSELRAWDPLTFICLQSLYLNFPLGSTIICKTPEFSRKSLIIHQVDSVSSTLTPEKLKEKDEVNGKKDKKKSPPSFSPKSLHYSKKKKCRQPSEAGVILLLYCNSFARIPLERERVSRWPFDYDQFIQEFKELSIEYDKKLKEKLRVPVVSATVKASSKEQTRKEEERKDNAGIDGKIIEEEGEGVEDNMQRLPSQEKFVDKKLSVEEMSDVESKLDLYMKEILDLRRTIKENGERGRESAESCSNKRGKLRQSSSDSRRLSTSTIPEETETLEASASPGPTTETFNISVHATNKYYEFKRAKEKNLPKHLERMISYGQAFNHYPLMELEPVQFTRKNLMISEEMKKNLGIGAMNSVQDLLTPQAQAYFGIDLHKSGSRFFPAKKSRKKVKSRDDEQQEQGFQGSDPFAVIGHKMRNAYEDDEEFIGDDRGKPKEDGFRVGRWKNKRISSLYATLLENEEVDDYDYD